MSDNRISMNDQTLLALYKKFQETRRSLGGIYPQARYDDFIDRGRYQGGALPVPMIAQDHMFEATNIINRFCYDLHSITAWSQLFDSLDEGEKMQALFEFIFPLASHSLSAPYAIKQMLVTSIYQISYHTNRFCNKKWTESSFNKRVNFPDAEKLAKKFESWPALSRALALLNSDSFVKASDDYRHQFHHGFPLSIEFGYRTIVEQEAPGSSSYVVRNAPPLLIGYLVPLLIEQYTAAFSSYGAWVDLIREQERIWPSPASQ